MCGVRAPISLKSSSERSIPASAASAGRWSTALVEPPSAIWSAMAFSKLSFESTSEGRRSSSTQCMTASPARRATSSRASDSAGALADPRGASPSASLMLAIVFAVYIPAHDPAPGHASRSSESSSSREMSP